MIRKLFIIAFVAGSILALTVSQALAAQGQITEVNPSGVGITKALNSGSGKVAHGLTRAGVATIITDELDLNLD